jgi:hypothetical protein
MRYIHQNPVKAEIVADIANYRWSSWHEYASSNPPLPPVCAVQSVFERINQQVLLELISSPLEMFEDPLDKEEEKTASHHVCDSEARDILRKLCPDSNICVIKTLRRKERNSIIESALEQGVGVRQLARLTGISFAIIQRINEKVGQRAVP